ncbi:MAG: hypothetical protein Q8P15_02750 [Nanoarchaeota archaeon]|nr:hypothetical protein [Nanoarchaeota archaeon]
MKMNTKQIFVSFLAIATVLILVANVSAGLAVNTVKVDDTNVANNDVSIVAGDTISVKVSFTSDVDASDVKIKAELEGDKVDVYAVTNSFDVIANQVYPEKELTLKVPYELKDQVSDDISLTIKVWNGDFKDTQEYTLKVQRPSYDAYIMSISTTQTIKAGELFPVDVVLKNAGYNDLDDLYVTAKIAALGVQKSAYFGDLVAVEDNSNDDDDVDTVSGRIYLQVPYNVEAGVYDLEVIASNTDTTSSTVKQVVVQNELPNVAIKSGDDLLVLNPTNTLKVYTVVTPSDQQVVVVPAGSSKTVSIAPQNGDFEVQVFASGALVQTVPFTGAQDQGTSGTSSVVILTVILAIVFLVLLVVLIVLMGKKSDKAEEFGESYY